MQPFAALLGISVALGLGAASPGASFVLVAQTAVSQSRRSGLWAAVGMGLGGVLIALAALLGLQSVLIAAPGARAGLDAVGGAYLLYVGVRIFRKAGRSKVPATPHADPVRAPRHVMAAALATQVSNPSTVLGFAAVFAAFLPATVSWGFGAAILAVVFAVEAGWYGVVVLALSAGPARRAYLRHGAAIGRVSGSVMALLALPLFHQCYVLTSTAP